MDIETIRSKLESGRILHFVDKNNRDYFYHKLKYLYKLRRSSRRGVQLHPEYIVDYKGEYQTGVGNQDYLRMFDVIYNLEINKW